MHYFNRDHELARGHQQWPEPCMGHGSRRAASNIMPCA